MWQNYYPLCLSFSLVVSQVCSVNVEEEEDEDRVHYDGYQVIRALPHSQDQLDTLHTIGEWDQSALKKLLPAAIEREAVKKKIWNKEPVISP